MFSLWDCRCAKRPNARIQQSFIRQPAISIAFHEGFARWVSRWPLRRRRHAYFAEIFEPPASASAIRDTRQLAVSWRLHRLYSVALCFAVFAITPYAVFALSFWAFTPSRDVSFSLRNMLRQRCFSFSYSDYNRIFSGLARYFINIFIRLDCIDWLSTPDEYLRRMVSSL